jgi:hypothetical protein
LVIPTLLDGCELWGAMNKLSYEQEKLFWKFHFAHEILANNNNHIFPY